MTLLSICKNAVRGLHAVPSTIVGNSDQVAVRLLQAAQDAGRSLHRRPTTWAELMREHTFTTVASTASYAVPTDLQYFLDETAWDRTNYWSMRGSMSAREWQWVKSGLATSVGLRKGYRIKWDTSSGANLIFIDPTPASADDLVLEYASTDWCESSGGTGQSAWAADTDVGRLDEYLIELETKWRYRKAAGEDFEMELIEAEEQIEIAEARNVPRRILYASDPLEDLAPLTHNLPDTGIGQ